MNHTNNILTPQSSPLILPELELHPYQAGTHGRNIIGRSNGHTFNPGNLVIQVINPPAFVLHDDVPAPAPDNFDIPITKKYKVIKQYEFGNTGTLTSNGKLKVGDIVYGEKTSFSVEGVGGTIMFIKLNFNPPRLLDTKDPLSGISNAIVPENYLEEDTSDNSLADKITSLPAVKPFQKYIAAIAIAVILGAVIYLIFNHD